VSQGVKKDNEIACHLLFEAGTKKYFIDQLHHDVNVRFFLSRFRGHERMSFGTKAKKVGVEERGTRD
jgi:hypothetical protein